MNRVYKYGVYNQPSPIGPIRGEMKRRAAYWAALCEIEAAYQRSVREVIACPETDAAVAAQAAYDAAPPAAKRDALATLKSAKSIAKEARTVRREQEATRLKELRADRYQAINRAREASELWRGNYMDVVEDFEMAAKRAAQIGVALDPTKPARCLTAMETPQAAFTADIMAGRCTWLQVDLSSDARGNRYPSPIARLRIGSDESRRPIWSEARIKMHRPLPEGAKIVRASFVLLHGNKWALCVTCKMADPDPARGGMNCTVTTEVSGDRVATVAGAEIAEIRLPGIEAKLAHADSIGRTLWDDFKREAVMYKGDSEEGPESPHALSRWARPLRKQLPEADAWVRRYEHLWNWVCGERRKAQNRRRALYANAAARIAATAVRVEFVGTPGPKWAALSELELALKSVCQRKGVEFASASDLRRQNQRRPSRRSQSDPHAIENAGGCVTAVAEPAQGL